ALFDQIVRSAAVLDICKRLIGAGLRLQGSKLNMKSAQYGSPVGWHQDWAFYPHTNGDILAIGVLLDDCDLSNGPMLVTPGTHTGEVWNHHGDDGCFAGLIDPDTIKSEIERAVPCMGRAGSMSFHHVRALHGSAMNTSDRPRNLLLYEVAASDAWPLMGVKDFDEFNSRLLSGDPVIEPRLTNVPVRMPLLTFQTSVAGFVVLPLGGILFGIMGDRFGRKPVLVATLLMIGIGTTAIGLLPTYAQIGYWAPALLVAMRVVQGLGAGAEYGGAVIFLVENAPAGHRGFWGGFAPLGVSVGNLVAAGAFALVTMLPREDLLSWGWRLPFLASFLLILVGIFVRLKVTETPVFTEAVVAR